MVRTSGRTTRNQVDYRALANMSHRIRTRLQSATVPTVIAQNQEVDTQEETTPPLPEGVTQCRHCKMQFTIVTFASQKHNRHHPDCELFDRQTNLSVTDSLRYDALLLWVRSLTCAGLKEQLKKYYQKTSGNKVIQIDYCPATPTYAQSTHVCHKDERTNIVQPSVTGRVNRQTRECHQSATY